MGRAERCVGSCRGVGTGRLSPPPVAVSSQIPGWISVAALMRVRGHPCKLFPKSSVLDAALCCCCSRPSYAEFQGTNITGLITESLLKPKMGLCSLVWLFCSVIFSIS